MHCSLFAICASLYTIIASSQANTSLLPLNSVTPLHNFSAGTWVENLRVRRSGDILVTFLAPEPAVYQIHPQTGQAYLVARIPGATSVSGMAEGLDDIFYVNALNISFDTLQGQRGSNAIWELDLQNVDPPFNQAQVEPKLVAEVPNARILNGLAVFDAAKGIYFTADWQGGVIYRVDVRNGSADVALANNYTASGAVGGVNGLEVHSGYLYWTSNRVNVLARVPVSKDGRPTGTTEVILKDFPSDDFTFDSRGNAYLVDNTTAVARLRDGSSKAEDVASGIANPTAVRFGRTLSDRDVLYVSSRGSNPSEQPGGPSVPARLSKIQLSYHDEL